MANIKIIILFLFTLIKIANSTACKEPLETNDKHECFERETDDDKELGKHCCFVTMKEGSNTYYSCELFLDEEYQAYNDGENDYPDIDDLQCLQSYLNFNYLCLFAFNLLLFTII